MYITQNFYFKRAFVLSSPYTFLGGLDLIRFPVCTPVPLDEMRMSSCGSSMSCDQNCMMWWRSSMLSMKWDTVAHAIHNCSMAEGQVKGSQRMQSVRARGIRVHVQRWLSSMTCSCPMELAQSGKGLLRTHHVWGVWSSWKMLEEKEGQWCSHWRCLCSCK